MTKTILKSKFLLFGIVIFASDFIEAQCTIANTPATFNSSSNTTILVFVQSFTATCSGNMDYFELTSTEAGTMPGATLNVYNGNVSSGSPIYTQAYPSITVSASGMPIVIDVTGTLPLVSGNQYSFQFTATSLNFRYTVGNQYSGGHIWQNGSPLTSTDFYFEIDILSSCTPTSIAADITQLPAINSQCSVAAGTPPTATNSCGTVVNGVPDVSFPILTQGNTQITWTYNDGEGNTTSQTQNVNIDDISAPVPNLAQLPDLTNLCQVTSGTQPTAIDNCAGVITGTTSATLPIQTPGNSTVTWSFDDGNGNISTQTQNVINPTIDNTVSVSGGMITANQLVAAYQWLDCDNAFAPISGEVNQVFAPTVGGNYAVLINVQGCVATSSCTLIEFAGLEEITKTKKELVKIIDILGRETEFAPNIQLFYLYSDGSTERMMTME